MTKVLVVDDSLSVRKVVERALVGRQIDVVCAASGSEALERLERDAPDAVVCDVVMPDRDGYEICEFIKRHPRLAHTPVLLMSGIVNDEVRERAARAQSAGILAKPFAADDLVRHLEGLLAQRPAAATRVSSAGESAPGLDAAAPRDTTAVPEGAAAILAQFLAMDGVQWAVLADREGFVVEATANAGVDAEVAAALSACLAESSDGLGRELGRGPLQGIILEYEKGMVVLYGVATSGLLAVGIGKPNILGKVRYYARRALPELARGM
jgi:CheY-like chemotaxis protein/predicted regulator of Ras-like GTPase activity (Roadblock/LC7/MglB family)